MNITTLITIFSFILKLHGYLDTNNKSKYDFNFWSYYGKFNMGKSITELIA